MARRPWLVYLGLAPLAHPILEILVFGERALQTAHDVFDDDVPRLFTIAADWREFGPSLWDPHLTSGNAVLAQFALSPLAPDVLLSFIVPPFVAYALNAALMTFLAGLAMHLFLRDSLKLPAIACFAGGALSVFAFWHYIYGYAALLLPLAILLTERAVAPGASRRAVASTAVLVGFLAISSQVQVVALAALLVLGWILLTADGVRDAGRRAARFFAPWVGGALLAAPILLSLLVAVGDSQRALWVAEVTADPVRTWVAQLATLPFGIRGGGLGGMRSLYGSWFPGVIGLLLLAISIAIPRPNRREKAALALLGVLLLADLLAVLAVPLQNELDGFLRSFQLVRVRHLVPPLIVMNLAIAIAWISRSNAFIGLGRKRAITMLALAGAALIPLVVQGSAIVGAVVRSLGQRRPSFEVDQGVLAWWLAGLAFAVAAGALVVAGWLVVRGRGGLRSRGVVSGAAIACLVVGMAAERAVFTRAGLLAATGMSTWADRVPATAAHEFIAGQPGGGRVLSVIEHANRSLSAGLDAVDGYQTIYPVRYHTLFGLMIRPQIEASPDIATYFGQWGNRAYAFGPGIRKPIADLLGVRWLYVGPMTEAGPRYVDQPVDPAFVRRFEADGLVVYENPGVFPRAFIVHAAAVLADRQAVVDAMAVATSQDLAQRAYLVASEAPGITLPGVPPGGTAEDDASFRLDTPDRIVVATRTDRQGLLVLADTYAPGWVAEVDGQPASIVPVDIALRGVSIPAGEHLVTFSYRPVETIVGFGVSLLTTFALIAWLLAPWPRRRHPEPVTNAGASAAG